MPASVPLLPIPADPATAIRHLVRVIGVGFHPDTSGSEYFTGDDPSFTPEECAAIDEALARALAALGEKVYSVAMKEMEALK